MDNLPVENDGIHISPDATIYKLICHVYLGKWRTSLLACLVVQPRAIQCPRPNPKFILLSLDRKILKTLLSCNFSFIQGQVSSAQRGAPSLSGQ